MENLQGPPPDNNLVWAIICTVACCMPLGIVSIIKSAKVKELWFQGDFIGAQKAADDAKKWAIWGIVSAAVIYFVFFGIYFIIILGATAGSF